MKLLKYIIGGGLAFIGGRYLYQLYRTGKKVVVDVTGRVHKVTLSGVLVVLNFNIKNPTNGSIEMSMPLIKLTQGNTVLASSSMSIIDVPEEARSTKDRIKIRPFKETGTITTRILLPTLSLLGASAKLLPHLKNRLLSSSQTQNNPPIEFQVETTSTVFTKIGSYPYDEKMTISV